MADIVSTAAQIGVLIPEKAEIMDYIAAAAITAGQPVYITSAGKADLCSAGAAGTAKFRGIALKTVGAGQAVSVCTRGHIGGFTLAGAYDSLLYLSNTAGTLADAAGTTSVTVGRVVPLTDKDLTKVLYLNGING